jgi:hypothetical protein
MKKLIALVVLVVGLLITGYAISHHTKKAPVPAPIEQTAAEVIEQEHSEVLPPPAPEAPYVATPTDPQLAPVPAAPKKRVVKKRRHVTKPRPQLVLPQPLVPHCVCKA